MRKLLASVAVCGLMALSSRASQAQQPAGAAARPTFGANASRYGIAVVDISFIFKNSPKFMAAINDLKTRMEASDQTLKQGRDQLMALEQQRDTLRPGTPDFKLKDEELARLKADFTIKQGTMRRDFLEQEAAIYLSTYNEIAKTVSEYALNNNIGLVLRFNGDPIDTAQREDVMRAITQPIVFENNIDVTPNICGLMGIPLPQPGAPAAGAAGAIGASPTAARPGATRQQ